MVFAYRPRLPGEPGIFDRPGSTQIPKLPALSTRLEEKLREFVIQEHKLRQKTGIEAPDIASELKGLLKLTVVRLMKEIEKGP